jgi:hypothetical protein
MRYEIEQLGDFGVESETMFEYGTGPRWSLLMEQTEGKKSL